MSTDEQKLTLRRQAPLAAPATAHGTSHEQYPPVTAISRAYKHPNARRLSQASRPIETIALREPQCDEHVTPIVERISTARPVVSPAGLSIAVLTSDADLSMAIEAAVAEQHPVLTISSVEEAARLAAQGRCPILITDQALTQPALDRITAPLRTHEPALVTIAVGNRGDDNALIGLLSAGAADRLLLKPVTAALARIVIESAVREHRAQKASANLLLVQRDTSMDTVEKVASATTRSVTLARSDAPTLAKELPQREVREAPLVRAPATARTRTSLQRPPWLVVIAGLAVVAFIAWWLTSRQLPDIDPRVVIDTNLAAARQAFNDGHYVEPPEHSALHHFSTVLALDPANAEARAGIDRIGNRYMEDAQNLLVAGRLAEAGLALDRARRVRPEDPRLQALDIQLREQIKGILTQAQASEARSESPSHDQPTTAAANAFQEKQVPARAAVESKPDAVVPQPAMRDELARANEEYAQAPLPAVQAIALNQPDAAHRLIDDAQNALEAALLANAPAKPEQEDFNLSAAPAPSAAPRLIKFVRPEFPSEALMRGFEGWVTVGLDVTAAGDVVNPRIEDSSSGRLFHRAALVAARQWRYERRAASEPLQHLQVRLEFKLPDKR